MACGVLNDSGTNYIYCVGGNPVLAPGTGRVFRYNPVTDTISIVPSPWPPGNTGGYVPGGFSVFNNKLYILGGGIFPGGLINQIWEFTPTTNVWVQKSAVLPVPLAFIPTTTIGSRIYTAGGSTFNGTDLVDTNNSFVYNPVADSISTIASIPRATGETRALNFQGKMYVMGGGRTPPNPSSEVDVYDPVNNTWSLGPAFMTARFDFPTDTDRTKRIWLSGGYVPGNLPPTASMEIFCSAASPSPTPTPTATPTPTPTPTATATPTPTPTPTVRVTVQTNPAGLTFSVDGTTYSSTQRFTWGSGSSHTISTTSPQSGGTGVQYVWTKWSDNGAISHTVAPTTNTTYTATFKTQYYLTMTAGTGGTVTPASGWQNAGKNVTIRARANRGFHFVDWTGSGTGSYTGPNNPASITMGGPITETGNFAP
jgi:hypothetical protein